LRILTKVLEENPQSVRETYYLAREYWYRKDFETAVRWYTDYLTRATWAPEMADAWLMRGRCLWHLQRGSEARDCCLKALKVNADFKEAMVFLAEMSGPKNRERWLLYAELTHNEDVLFVREPSPKPPEYYDRIFAGSKDMSRYENLLRMAASWTWGRVLDVCCGTGELGKYVQDYHGIDFSEEAVRGNPKLSCEHVFACDLAGYDTYVILEALEHLDDLALLSRIPPGSDVVFSVPSFSDPSHVRVYSERIVRLRYADLLKIQRVVRFNWSGEGWSQDAPNTEKYILLVRAVRVST
jgi:tetratricopeptide (TPR) repeat protein